MKVAVLGTGDVGQVLGKAFLTLGHEVAMGSRSATNDKAVAFAKAPGARAATFADAVKGADLVVLCTLGLANEEVLRAAGVSQFAGKVVIDTTNPLDFSKGMPPRLAISGEDSGGERVQKLLPGAHVVKAFNTIGNPMMFKPQLPGGPPTMFIAGNDDAAKKQVSAWLTRDFGFDVMDAGGIESSRYLEAMCLLWVLTAAKTGKWMQAFKMLRG